MDKEVSSMLSKGAILEVNPSCRTIPEQAVHHSKEGWVKQTSSKFASIESVHTQAALQDGEHSKCKGHAKEGQLDGFNRPKGRFLLNSSPCGILQVAQILMKGKAASISACHLD